MLGPFNHTPSPGKDRRVTHAVAWVTLALVLLIALLSVVLPLRILTTQQNQFTRRPAHRRTFSLLADLKVIRPSPASMPVYTVIR